MIIHEFGNKSAPVIILLHPMCVTGRQIYKAFKHYLDRDYLTIAPDQGGHGEDRADYTDADTEARILADFLLSHNYTHIHLLYGASMGTAVALRLMQEEGLTFDHIHLDAATLVDSAPVLCKVMTSGFLLARRVAPHHRRLTGNIFQKLYGREWGRCMTANFLKLSDGSVQTICRACCTENCCRATKGRKVSSALQKKIIFEWGDKEIDYRLSRKNLEKYFPESRVVIRKGYGHCSYMAAETENYVKELLG